jgi:hypothetical protein
MCLSYVNLENTYMNIVLLTHSKGSPSTFSMTEFFTCQRTSTDKTKLNKITEYKKGSCLQ